MSLGCRGWVWRGLRGGGTKPSEVSVVFVFLFIFSLGEGWVDKEGGKKRREKEEGGGRREEEKTREDYLF